MEIRLGQGWFQDTYFGWYFVYDPALMARSRLLSAVDRHRVARRLRHVARTMLGDLHQSDRVVIRALPGSPRVSSARLEQQLRRGLRRAFESAGRDR